MHAGLYVLAYDRDRKTEKRAGGEATRDEQTPTCTITLPGKTSSISKHLAGRPEARERS
jgi:hypothetical protein